MEIITETNGEFGKDLYLTSQKNSINDEEVIANNPKAIEDFRGGKEKALGALVGQIMKAMKGKANPGMVNELLREMLK